MIKRFRLWSIATLPMWLLLLIQSWSIPISCSFRKEVDWDSALHALLSPANIVALLSGCMLIIGMASIHYVVYRLKGSPDSLPEKISDWEDMQQDYVKSLATMISLFSVLLIDYDSYRDLLILLVLLIAIYVCYVQTNLYYANPIMALLGYKIAKVETGSKTLPQGSILLYRGDLEHHISYHKVAANVYIVCQKAHS